MQFYLSTLNMKTKITLLVLLAFLQTAFANVENPYEGNLKKGWDAFNTNHRDEAKKYFNLAAKEAKTKSEALLALSLLSWNEGKNEEAFTHFQQFYTITPNPYPYVYALWMTGSVNSSYEKKSTEHQQFLKKICADPKANGTMKALAYHMLGSHYMQTWDFEAAKKEFNNMGAITEWQLAGSFDNTSGSGFDKAHAPITNPQQTAEFVNKVGAKVKWFPVKSNRHDKWLDFSYHFDYDNSIIYAQTYANSPADQDVIVRVGVSGSIKVWVNDKLIITEAEERNTDLDTYNATAKLKKGYNRILVQVGISDLDRGNFMLRLTDEEANPISGIKYTSEEQTYTAATSYESKTIPLFAESFFESKTKEEPTILLNYILLSETYLRNDKAYEARKALHSIRNTAPQSSFLAFRFINVYSRLKNETELSKEVEWLKENDSQNILSIALFIEEAKNKEDYDEVERLVNQMEKAFGLKENVIEEKLQLAAKRQKYDEMIRIVNEAYATYPDHYSFVYFKYLIEIEANKNIKAGIAILEKYLKKNFNESASRELVNLYMKSGSPEKGLKYFEELIKFMPYATGFYNSMADLHFNLQNYPKALEWEKKAIEQAPYIGAYWGKAGKMYQEQNKKEEAKEAYRKAIYYAPNSYEVRKKLRKLEDKKEVFSYFQQPDVYDIYKKSPKADKFPDDNSLILHNEVQRVIYTEGGWEEKNILLIKVFNSAGIDNFKEYSLSHNSYTEKLTVEKAEVIKANGNKIAAEVNDNYVVFTALEAGDAIHITHRIESYAGGKLAGHFWNKFNFNYFYPIQTAKYSLLAANNKQFNYKVSNTELKPLIKPADDFLLYVWEKKDQPSLKDEVYMPPLTDVGQVLYLSSITDWNYVANWYADISATKATSDFEVKEVVNQLFEGKTKLTELEKAKIIYEYIVKNIRYSSISFRQSAYIPQKASKTINTKLGDCKDVSTLFVAMAKEMGLKANLVLVDTRDNGEKDMLLPSIEFNHCIAQVKADGKNYFIELTSDNLPFGTCTSTLNKALALSIPREVSTTPHQLVALSMDNHPVNEVRRQTEIRIVNNDLSIKRKNTRKGIFASGYRNQYNNIGKEAQEKQMLQTVSEDFKSAVKLTSFNFKNLDNLEESLESEITLEVKNGLTEVGGMKILSLPWVDREKSLDFIAAEKRITPMNFWYHDGSEVNHEVITLILPAGKTLAEVPASQTLNCKAMSYKITYKAEQGKLTVIRETTFKQDVINPEDYQQFKEFVTKVMEADSKQIAIK
jgi:tetratricopeptide (TPR) repeat protein